MRQLGHRVTIFGNYGGDNIRPDSRWRIVTTGEDGPDVVRCFDTPVWSHGGQFDFARIMDEIPARGIGTVIISYQCALFEGTGLERLLSWLTGRGVRTIAILHDSYIQFDQTLADVQVVTGPSMLSHAPDATVIPQGILEVEPVPEETTRREYGLEGTLVATLGLGRTDYALVDRAVRRLGWRFLVFDPTRSCPLEDSHVVRVQQWLPQPEIVRILQVVKATVLWYPPVPAEVTSSAAHIAVASRRPVIVNKTLSCEDDLERLERQGAYIRANSWTETARRYLALCR